MVEVVCTDEFVEWFEALPDGEARTVMNVVDVLELAGVSLGEPHSSALKGTRYALRELRPKRGRSPVRVVYAFDPRRQAVLLLGGHKGRGGRFYERLIEKSEKLWEEHLAEQAAGMHDEE